MAGSSDAARQARSPPGKYSSCYYPQANLKVETKVETETHGGEKLKLKLMVVNGGVGDGMVTESKRGRWERRKSWRARDSEEADVAQRASVSAISSIGATGQRGQRGQRE